MTREEWLTKLVSALAELADELQLDTMTDQWRGAKASCGYGLNKTRKRVFDVLRKDETVDGKPQIYISPTVCETADAIGAVFSAIAALAGGTHKTNTKDFKKALKVLSSMEDFAIKEVKSWQREYPQPALKGKDEEEKEETTTAALLKVVCKCPVAKGEKPYVVRLTRKQADRALPCCGICGATMRLDEKEGKEGV